MQRGILLSLIIVNMCIVMMLDTVFAASSNDCNQFSSSTPAGVATSIEKKFAENDRPLLFFTDDDIQIATSHLQQYCCDEGKSNEEDDCKDVGGTAYYPSSIIFLDHLLDVGFRKLDGVEEHCNILGISCDNRQTVPNLSTKRRERITEIAEDREGYPPIVIQEEFTNYRGDYTTTTESLKSIPQEQWSSVDTLYGQYMLLCEEIYAIHTWIVDKPLQDITGAARDPLTACKHMAQQRYHQERKYVRTLMVEKAISYYTQNLESYLLDYFLDNRFDDLADKYTGLEACFSSVLSYSTNTSCCNE